MRVLVLGVMLTMGMGSTAWAVPPQINAQGVLKDAGGVPLEDGALEVTFRLYDDQAKTTLLWSELQTIDLFGGVFNTLLPEDPINADLSPAAKAVIAAGGELWLTIEPDGQAETDPVPLVSVPYAWTAGSALIASDLACSGCIDASDIAGGALAATVLDYDDTNAGLGASTVQGAIDMLAALVDDLALQVARPTTVGTTGGNLTIGNVAYQWPATAGTNGQVLTYNASGGLSWQSPSTGGAVHYVVGTNSEGWCFGFQVDPCPSGWTQTQTGSWCVGSTGDAYCTPGPCTQGTTSLISGSACNGTGLHSACRVCVK